MSWPYRSRSTGESGFTIVEFMIATTVFSVVLLVVTAAVLYIGRTYQRSLYASSTQAATSNLVDTLAQAIKFSGGTIDLASSGETRSICVGNRQFLYVIGRQLDGGSEVATQTRNAVVTRQRNNCTIEPLTGTVSGSFTELLGRGMRLSRLDITPTGSMYTISARVAYGDDDLLCSPTQFPGSCDSATPMTAANLKSARDLVCKPMSGSEFCAVSEISTTVYRRL